jgi:16S rRNA processing protein RimM
VADEVPVVSRGAVPVVPPGVPPTTPGTQAESSASTHHERGLGGSSNPPEPRFLALGRILRPHGVRGEVVVEVMTDFPERFEALETVYLGDAQQATPHRLRSRRQFHRQVLLAFEGYPDRTSVEGLREMLVQVPLAEATPLPEDSYYPHQLVGLDVVTTDGQDLGRISDVLFVPANDVYVVNGPRGEVLLPAIHQVIKRVDLAAGRIVVELMPGLLP